ncbi:MAG: hypothetical protein M5R40_27125 [Anaerolineae bacterium]|nr:hypothetical protein [Anaerolineae bacterium]
MKPVVHRLEAEYWGEVDFVYLDRDDRANRDVMNRYDFSYQPLFVFVEPDGTEIQRWFGSVPEADLRAAFDAYLAAPGG